MKMSRNETSRVDLSQQWLAIAGIIAPILYISVATIMGLLEPGYSHRTMWLTQQIRWLLRQLVRWLIRMSQPPPQTDRCQHGRLTP
jgi:hypothetical protein